MLLIDYLDKYDQSLHYINTKYLMDISLNENNKTVILVIYNHTLTYQFESVNKAKAFIDFILTMQSTLN